MLTHLRKTTTNTASKTFERGSCGKRRSFRNSYIQLTDNKAEVDCVKCAKAEGFEPKALKQSKHRTGTCQCCFHNQKVSKGGGKLMSLHGYQRPGIGYILGECQGQEQQPYEVSCEKTKEFKAEVERMRTGQQKRLDQLNANEVLGLITKIERPRTEEEKADHRTSFKTMYQSFPVARGDEEKTNPFYPTSPWMKVPSFEQLRQSEIAQTESIITQMTHHIEFLGEKIASWKQMWEA